MCSKVDIIQPVPKPPIRTYDELKRLANIETAIKELQEEINQINQINQKLHMHLDSREKSIYEHVMKSVYFKKHERYDFYDFLDLLVQNSVPIIIVIYSMVMYWFLRFLCSLSLPGLSC